MPDLEQQLQDLATAIEWPATPQLRPRLLSTRAEVPGRATRWRLWGRPLAVAVAALLIVAVALVAYPPSRTAIANWVNLHVGILRVENPPTPSPLPSGTLGDQLGLGLPYPLVDAQRQVSWKITVPSDLGQPDAVYVKYPPTLKQITLVYAQRADIPVSGLTGVSVLVSEARGSINEQFFSKILGPDTTLEEVSVGGRAGYWISGHPHNFVFTDADGQPFFDEMRLATNTLIYDRGDGTIVRIEADTTKERAIQIALSM